MHRSTKFSIAAFIAMGAFAASAVVALAAPAIATSTTTLRDDASYSADGIETVYAGDEVDVQDCTYSWCYVDHDGTEGWIRKSRLAFVGSHHHHPYPVEPGATFGFDLGSGNSMSLGLSGY